MKLWPLWLDRLYWRWYFRRHPIHSCHCPTDVWYRHIWRQIQREAVEGLRYEVEELKLLKTLLRPSTVSS